MTRNIETEILRRTVDALLAMPGVTGLHVDDGGYDYALRNATDFDMIKDVCFGVDDCIVRVPRCGSVYFIWGNGNDGLDAITDYTVKLEEPLKPVFEWIEQAELAATWAQENMK